MKNVCSCKIQNEDKKKLELTLKVILSSNKKEVIFILKAFSQKQYDFFKKSISKYGSNIDFDLDEKNNIKSSKIHINYPQLSFLRNDYDSEWEEKMEEATDRWFDGGQY